jgi:preprotein translocase subunit YajC
MIDIAYAQTAPGLGGPGPMMTIFPFILIFVIMYFMVIRPQQKKSKQHQEMLNKLKKNDEVITSGGIYGKVIDLKDTVVTLEVAPNVRIAFTGRRFTCHHRRQTPAKKQSRRCADVLTRLIVFLLRASPLVYLTPTSSKIPKEPASWWSSSPSDRIH